MKKIKIYLESSALWNLYYEEAGADLIEYCFNSNQVDCVSSIWSLLEIERGIKKRENQKELTPSEAENLAIFVEMDSRQLINKKKLNLTPVLDEHVITAKRYIRTYNLYASDAIHLASAVNLRCDLMLVDDYHFKRLDRLILRLEAIRIQSTMTPLDAFKRELSV